MMKYNQYNRFRIKVEYNLGIYKYTILYQDKKVFSIIILALRQSCIINRIVSALNSRESKKKLKYNKKLRKITEITSRQCLYLTSDIDIEFLNFFDTKP